MKKHVRIFGVLLALLLLSANVVSAEQASVATGNTFPIVEEPITLECFVGKGAYTTGEFNDLPIWKEYEALTNIHVNFEGYQIGSFDEKMSLKMAANDLPDFFMKTTMKPADITKYSQDGNLAPITPYLEDYAPNYLAQMDEVPNLRGIVTMGDGDIYGFAYIVSASPASARPIFYNEKWLDQLGYDEFPTDLTGLKELLLLARDSDYNGNGRADEIPLISNTITNINHTFRGAFGIGTRGYNNLDMGPNGELRQVQVTDEYKNMLMFLNELYTEGLLYQQIFDGNNIPAVTAAGEQNQVFMAICNATSYLGETYKGDYAGVYEPFTGYEGQKLNSMTMNTVSGQNTFITTANEHPEATVRWIDYFYSDPGVELYFMGLEGVTYEIDADGIPRYTEAMTNSPDGLGLEEVLGKFVPWGGGANPSRAEDRCFGANMYPDLERGITEGLLAYAPDEVWGEFNYSLEDSVRRATLEQDIVSYIDEMTAKFVTGNVSFDEWDTYLSNLDKMGFAELMEIYNRGYENYTAAFGK